MNSKFQLKNLTKGKEDMAARLYQPLDAPFKKGEILC